MSKPTPIRARGTPQKFSVSVGKWDQVFTLGIKNQDGTPITIDESSCSQMMDNFAARSNDIGMDYEHVTASAFETGRPAPQLAFYSALALVVSGQLKKFVTHDASVTAPDVTGMTDGLFAYRYRVTPLGEQLLPNYAYISPFFAMEDKNEAGEDIGPNILNISAVSVPFQDGCAISFSSTSAPSASNKKVRKMADDLFKRLGLDDGASPEEMKAAMGAYLKKMDDDKADAEKKMADAAEDEKKMSDGDGDEDDKKKMADEADDKEKMSDDGDEDDKKAMTAMRKELGLSEDAPAKKVYAAFSAKYVPATDVANLQKRLDSVESDLKAERDAKIAQAAEAAVSDAIKLGRQSEGKREVLLSVAKRDLKEFEALLEKPGTFTVLKRFTKDGNPIGVEKTEAQDYSAPTAGATGLSEIGSEFSAEVKKVMTAEKISHTQAMSKVFAARPDLYPRNR